MATDGPTGMLSMAALRAITRASPDARRVCRQLNNEADLAGDITPGMFAQLGILADILEDAGAVVVGPVRRLIATTNFRQDLRIPVCKLSTVHRRYYVIDQTPCTRWRFGMILGSWPGVFGCNATPGAGVNFYAGHFTRRGDLKYARGRAYVPLTAGAYSELPGEHKGQCKLLYNMVLLPLGDTFPEAFINLACVANGVNVSP